MAKSTAVLNPNLGLYLDRPPLAVPKGAVQDGLNFRIQQGKINNLNLGWSSFGPFQLNGRVMMIATLHLRNGTDRLVLSSPTDVYSYNPAGLGSVTYLTSRYSTGTVNATGTAVVGSGTLWNTGTPKNAKAGDEISFGNAAQTSPAATWFVIQSVNNDTSITLTTSAGVVAPGTVYTIRKKLTGTATDIWQFDEFVNASPSGNDLIFMTNGVDPVMTWNGTDTQVTVQSTLGFTCKTLCMYKNMMIYGNLVQGGVLKPTDIVNSDVGTPLDTLNGLASQFKISGTTDGISTMARLGDLLTMYEEQNLVLANFVGDPIIFVFRVAVAGIGLMAPRGVAIYPDYHQYLGADSLYKFDGSTATYEATHVWREVIRTQDPARVRLPFTHLDESVGDYIFSVPLTSDPGAGTATSPGAVAFGHHYLEKMAYAVPTPWSKRSWPFTAAGFWPRQTTLTWDQLTNAWNTYNFKWNDQFFAAAFTQNLVGDANGFIWVIGSQDANSVALPSFVKFGRAATVDGMMRGLLARVYPFVTKFSNPVNITARLADFAVGPATINATASYDQSFPEGQYMAPIYRRGRYLDLEFGTSGPGQPYEITGYDLDIRPGGRR